MSGVLYPEIHSGVAFQPDRFFTRVLAESERTKVILACFEPGQFIPVHRPGVDLTLIVLEGQGRGVVGAPEHPLTPGAVAFVPAGEARGVLGRESACCPLRRYSTAYRSRSC